MTDNNNNFERIIKTLYPPFIYFMIMVIVEGIAGFIIIINEFGRTNLDNALNISVNYESVINNELNKYSIIITAISAIFGILIFLTLYTRECSLDKDFTVSDQLRCKKMDRHNCCLILLLAAATSLGLSRLIYMLPFKNLLDSYQEVSASLLKGNIIIQIIVLGIIVPLVEELVYRGMLFRNARKLWSEEVSMVVVSLAFGIFHFNIIQGVYAFLISLIMVYLLTKFNSLLPCVIFHGMANITTVITSYLPISKIISDNIFLDIFMTVVELLIMGLTFYILRRRINFADKSNK